MSNKEILPTNKHTYRAVIIGAGRIGATFDTPKSADVLTHAHGYLKHPKVDLVGFYDVDFNKANTAAKLWSSKSFRSLKALVETGNPDIVSICTPDDNHRKTLEQVIAYKPKLIICEKPVTTSSEETKRIIQLARKNSVPILINYSRRFDSSVQTFQESFQKGEYGEVLSAVGTYVRGALHNGSHMMDLARFLFGEVKKVTPLFTRDDFTSEDKSVAAFLSFEQCPQFHLAIGDGRNYFVFELDILFEKERWRFVNSGFAVSVQKVVDDHHYSGFARSLIEVPKINTTALGNACTRLIENAVSYLEGQEKLLCSIEDALETQNLCEKLITSSL